MPAKPDQPRPKSHLMMTDITDETLQADGWTEVDTSGFLNLIGPLWQRAVDGTQEYAILAQDKHHNRRDRVQGGVLMTLLDRASGMIARLVSGRPTLATVQMDVHFIDAGQIGELLIAKPRVVRVTHTLIFTTAEVVAEGRVVATASGVFKILKDNS
jgi:uncharacterized protein (TIGR00369 family)